MPGPLINTHLVPPDQIKQPIDIFLTHDWPRNIYNYGNKAQLLSRKQFLREEVRQGVNG